MKKLYFVASVSLIIISFGLLSCNHIKRKTIELQSPDGNISIITKLKTSGEGSNYPCYSILYKGKILVNESDLSIEFDGSDCQNIFRKNEMDYKIF